MIHEQLHKILIKEFDDKHCCDVILPLTIHVAFSHSPLSKQIIVGWDALYPTEQLTSADAPYVVLFGSDSNKTPLSIVLTLPQSTKEMF